MHDKFLLLKIFECSPLELATVRSLLSAQSLRYVEIDNLFVVACYKASAKTLSEALKAAAIRFLLLYVNNKAGAAVFANGLNDGDCTSITKMVENP